MGIRDSINNITDPRLVHVHVYILNMQHGRPVVRVLVGLFVYIASLKMFTQKMAHKFHRGLTATRGRWEDICMLETIISNFSF